MDTFQFIVAGILYAMENGALFIDGVEYEEDDNDPIYALVRAYHEEVIANG